MKINKQPFFDDEMTHEEKEKVKLDFNMKEQYRNMNSFAGKLDAMNSRG